MAWFSYSPQCNDRKLDRIGETLHTLWMMAVKMSRGPEALTMFVCPPPRLDSVQCGQHRKRLVNVAQTLKLHEAARLRDPDHTLICRGLINITHSVPLNNLNHLPHIALYSIRLVWLWHCWTYCYRNDVCVCVFVDSCIISGKYDNRTPK